MSCRLLTLSGAVLHSDAPGGGEGTACMRAGGPVSSGSQRKMSPALEYELCAFKNVAQEKILSVKKHVRECGISGTPLCFLFS